MKHEIKTTISNDGWTQMLECVFLNEAIAKLILEDTETSYHWNSMCIMQPQPEGCDRWWDVLPAAELHQQGNTVTVRCNGKDTYWHKDHEANKSYLERLAETWQGEAKQWLRMHRYHAAALKPTLQTQAGDIEAFKQWKEDMCKMINLSTAQAHSNESTISDLEKLLEQARASLNKAVERTYQNKADIELLGADIKEVKEVQANVLDCLDMDVSRISATTRKLALHTKKRFAHFSTRREKGGG